MRKLKLVKVVSPELVAYLTYDGENLPDYRCSVCASGVADDYVCCPYCGAELDWKHKDKKSKEFRKLMDSI